MRRPTPRAGSRRQGRAQTAAKPDARSGTWTIRDVPPGRYTVADVFEGLEHSYTLNALRPDVEDRLALVRETTLIISPEDVYAYVGEDGCVYIGHDHLHGADRTVVYLDILHELVHVTQRQAGRELRDRRYRYVDRPTEVDAYALVVEEARRLGLSDAQIADYLYVEWTSREDHLRLCRRLGVAVPGNDLKAGDAGEGVGRRH